jgi:hypothetical protein
VLKISVDRKRKKGGVPLVKWHCIAKPKSLGGWGLKNIHHFGKALTTKSLRRVINYTGLWKKVISRKYIEPLSVENWIRMPTKLIAISSIMWKALVLSFLLFGNWLAWRIGDGEKVRTGKDPWIGCDSEHKLPYPLIHSLHLQGLFTLADATDPGNSSIWNQGWKIAARLGLESIEATHWNSFSLASEATQWFC